MAREVVSERWSATQQRRLDVQPRIKRGFAYALVRAWATVIQRDLQVEAVISDVYAGRPVAYTTFLAYDEVAHHSGIERPDTLATLRRVDRQIARIAAAAEHAPRPYRLRGPVRPRPVARARRSSTATASRSSSSWPAGACRPTASPPSELGRGARLPRRLARGGRGAADRARTVATAVPRGARSPRARRGQARARGARRSCPRSSVMASGCLGLISFPREPGRVTLERLETLYPDLLAHAARRTPGIGFLLVRSGVARRGRDRQRAA